MDYNIYFWIMTIMNLSTKIEYYADNLEKRVDELSVCLTKDTYVLIDEILDLNNKKIMLINLKVLYSYLTASLKKDERIIIEEYAKNQTLEEIAKILEVNRSTVLRRMNKAIKKCAFVLTALGYNSNKFNEEYSEFSAVYYTYARIKNEHNVRQAASRKKQLQTENAAQENYFAIVPGNGAEYGFEKKAF